jgi:hypothetical protein
MLLFDMSAGRAHPLTAPAVRPATIRRWKTRTGSITAIVTTTAGAAMSPYGTVNCETPGNDELAAGAVCALVVEVSEVANTKSFQRMMRTSERGDDPRCAERHDHLADRQQLRRPVDLRGSVRAAMGCL